MKNITKSVALSLLSLLFSCSENTVDEQIKDCINSYQEKTQIENFTHCAKNIEAIFIKKNYIKSNKKDNYLILIDQFDDTFKNKLLLEIERNNSECVIFFTSNLLEIYKRCLYDVFDQNADSIYLKNLIQLIEELQISGFKNKSVLRNFIEDIHFENEQLKILSIGLIYNYLLM